MRILVAGIGNIFFGDDAFGIEVIRSLSGCRFGPQVRMEDFGIRGYDLACALADGYDAAILVDAAMRGEDPGTVSLVEPGRAGRLESGASGLDAHSLDPARVLQMASEFGPLPQKLYLVACEPESLEPPEGGFVLSGAVAAAVPAAAGMVQRLVRALLDEKAIGGDRADVKGPYEQAKCV